MISAYFV